MKTDNKFNLHEYFGMRCPVILDYLNEHIEMIEDNTSSVEGKTGQMRSPTIEISYNIDKVNQQYEEAVYAMKLCIGSIKSMGFDVKIEKLYWHSVKDSDWNILGNKGFYALVFSFEPSKTK